MAQIKDSIFANLALPSNADIDLQGKRLIITKWNWEFSDCEKFQKSAQELIAKNRDHEVYIFCNHPHCYTLGRGNERGREDLVEFDENLIQSLSLPIHKIHRGGGITFHFPGQWIFYPIKSINQNYTLETHMCWLLKHVKEIIRDEYGLKSVMATKKLMGVWYERKKFASIGVGLNRFVTEHGIALNLFFDEKMRQELIKINPCGMNSDTYIALKNYTDTEALLDDFHAKSLKKLGIS